MGGGKGPVAEVDDEYEADGEKEDGDGGEGDDEDDGAAAAHARPPHPPLLPQRQRLARVGQVNPDLGRHPR